MLMMRTSKSKPKKLSSKNSHSFISNIIRNSKNFQQEIELEIFREEKDINGNLIKKKRNRTVPSSIAIQPILSTKTKTKNKTKKVKVKNIEIKPLEITENKTKNKTKKVKVKNIVIKPLEITETKTKNKIKKVKVKNAKMDVLNPMEFLENHFWSEPLTEKTKTKKKSKVKSTTKAKVIIEDPNLKNLHVPDSIIEENSSILKQKVIVQDKNLLDDDELEHKEPERTNKMLLKKVEVAEQIQPLKRILRSNIDYDVVITALIKKIRPDDEDDETLSDNDNNDTFKGKETDRLLAIKIYNQIKYKLVSDSSIVINELDVISKYSAENNVTKEYFIGEILPEIKRKIHLDKLIIKRKHIYLLQNVEYPVEVYMRKVAQPDYVVC